MDIADWLLFSSMLVLITADMDHHGHSKEQTTVMDTAYCNGNGYNDAEEIKLNHATSWHVTWSGYAIGEDDFCGISFSRSDDVIKIKDSKLCVTPELFNITDCGATVEYYAIEKLLSGSPSMIYNCTHSPMTPFCTTKPILMIIVESTTASTSELQFHVHVESTHNPNGSLSVHSSVFMTTILLTLGIFIIGLLF